MCVVHCHKQNSDVVCAAWLQAAPMACGPWLQLRLGRLCEAVADELAAFTTTSLQCFWAAPDAGPLVGPNSVRH